MDKLRKKINAILEEYATEVDRKSAECTRKVSAAGAAALRRVSPVRKKRYAPGWTYKVEQGRLHAKGTIYNSKRPGLAHLLEHGHVTRNGTGRVFTPTPAHVHIAPVEAQIAADFEKQIRIELS